MSTTSSQRFDKWIANRTLRFESSGIRRAFALKAKMKDPIDLSIGQPDFDVPGEVKHEICRAVNENQNGYTPTEGIPALREKLKQWIDGQLGPNDRKNLVCSGTSGGITLAMLSFVNPGDEVIFFDPYFVMYPAIVEMVGAVPVPVNTYPDFQIDIAKLEAKITPKTKMIIVNSPSNPTGVCYRPEVIQAVAELARDKGICLVSDEIYSRFRFDDDHVSPAMFNPDCLVVDGFSKAAAMTGLRVGFVHGPGELIEVMAKLQQFTFVCSPQPAQWGAIKALDLSMEDEVNSYRRRRDHIVESLQSYYEIASPGGAFFAFPKLPWGAGDEFQMAAFERNVLLIPGNVFSRHDTHFRLSYAVSDAKLDQGIEVLKTLARNRAV
ncbi:MAG: pyridoxal phosphate-dependent aminotransferase [Pirellulaceae bacterium]